MADDRIRIERTQNLWGSFERKFEPIAKSIKLDPDPQIGLDQIGGLSAAKEEIQTYACAATDPGVYGRWGTYPPSGLLLIGNRGVGKRLLAKSLATQTGSGFLCVAVPQLVLEIMHESGKVGELMAGWSHALTEMPRVTILFNELEFSQVQEIGARRPDLPVGPVMDFLLNLVDRTAAAESHLMVGSTSHPNTLRQAFVQPGRFERVVEVAAEYPGDLVEALAIHSANSEQRASERLFDGVDWKLVVERYRGPVAGDWVRIMHAVLRRKARSEAAGENPSLVTTQDLLDEVDRYRRASTQIIAPQAGNYV